MPRLEMTLWTPVMLALAFATTAKADPPYQGPPVGQAYALSIELSREAAALSYEVERLLCDCSGYDDVLEELCDVANELEDLNRTLREATFNRRKWKRVCRRAEEVMEEVCELDEEIHQAVDHLNRYRPRLTSFAPPAFVPRGPSNYRSAYRNVPGVSVSLRFNSRRAQSAPHVNSVTPRGIAWRDPYRGPAAGFVQPRVGYELESRVHRMRALAEQIHWLAHAG